jgi:hypothetical protein
MADATPAPPPARKNVIVPPDWTPFWPSPDQPADATSLVPDDTGSGRGPSVATVTAPPGPAAGESGLLRATALAGPRWRPNALLLALAALLLAVAALAGVQLASSSPASDPASPALLPLADESSGNLSIAGDCGYSAVLPGEPGQSLWLFCDTPVYGRRNARSAWKLQGFVPGSTAAVGAAATGTGGVMPGTLTEAGSPRVTGGAPGPLYGPKPQGVLAPFLGPPAGLITPDGQPCGDGGQSYPASWISGVAQIPSTPDLLIAFNNFCVLRQSSTFTDEGFGLEEYDPADRTLSNDATIFYGQPGSPGAAPVPLGSPIFEGSYLYLFGTTCAGEAAGGCAGTSIEVRVPASPLSWLDPLSYQWQAAGPSGPWSSDPGAATALVPGLSPTGAQDVQDFRSDGHGFVMIEQTSLTGAFTIYQAPGPDGPWTQVRTGRVACGRGIRPGFANFCRAIVAHPELSSRSQIVLSYFDPTKGPGGHLMIQRFRW